MSKDIKFIINEYILSGKEFVKNETLLEIPIKQNSSMFLTEERDNDLISGGDLFDDFENIRDAKKITTKKTNSEYKLKYLFDSNTLLDIKRFIYSNKNIPVESQYLECKRNGTWECMDYKFKYNGLEENDTSYLDFYTRINDMFDSVEYIYNIPMDLYLYSNRDSYSIKSNSYMSIKKFIQNAIIEKNTVELRLFNLAKIIENEAELLNILSKDPEQSNIFYGGFLEKFYPMIPNVLMTEFIKNKNIWKTFKLLELENITLADKVEGMETLFRTKNLKSVISNKASEYIKHLNFVCKSKKTYNIKQLFNSVNLNKDIQKVDCYLSNKDIYLERVFKNSNPSSIKKVQINVDENSTLVKGKNSYIVVYIKQKIKDIKTNEYHTMTIFSNGIILGKCVNEDSTWAKKDIIKYYNSYLIPLIIENIPDLDLDINFIKNNNAERSISSTVLYNYSATVETMQRISSFFKEYEKLEHYKVSSSESVKDSIALFVSYRKKNYFKSKNYNNDFLIMLNEQYINAENALKVFTANSTILITPRINDIKVDFNNLTSDYYESYNDLFNRILSYAISKVNIRNIIDINKVKRIKFLRENDPVLFNIDNSYSRLCQSDQQPLVLSKDQVKKGPKIDYVKFWNFTRGEPEYYGCDSKKYKWLKFLTGSHPKNFCLPCCKKKQVELENNTASVYKHKHDSCVSKENNFSYNPSDVKIQVPTNRYISNYSCKLSIDENRFMKPSASMFKFLDRKDKSTNMFIFGVGSDLLPNCSTLKILSLLNHKISNNYIKMLKEIIDFLNKNIYLFDAVLDGSLRLLFSDVKHLTTFLIEMSTDNILDYDYNLYSIINWNYLFLEIYSIMSGSNIKFVILKEIDNNTINDSYITPHVIGGDYIYEDDGVVFLVERNINGNPFIYPIVQVDINYFYSNNLISDMTFKKEDYGFINMVEYLSYKKTIQSSNSSNFQIDFNLIASRVDIKKVYINSKMEFEYVKVNIGFDIIFEIEPIKKWHVKNIDKYSNYGTLDDVYSEIDKSDKELNEIINNNIFRQVFNNGNNISIDDITASVFENDIIGIWFKNIYIHTGKIKYNKNVKSEVLLENPYVKYTGKNVSEYDEKNAIYMTNSYNLLLLHVNNVIVSLKNKEIRSKLISIFSKLINGNKESLFNDIENILQEYPHSKYLLLTKLINNKINSKLIKGFLEYFDNTHFDFDKDSINYILKSKDKKKGIEYLKEILSDFVSVKQLNNDMEIDIDLAKCKEGISSLYCDSGKLILNNELYEEYLEILYEDLTNDLKKKYILNYNEVKTLNLNIKNFTGSDIIIHKL